MATFQKWVKSCITNLVDSERDAEVAALTKLLHEGIVAHKKSFVLSQVLGDRPYKQSHLEQAKIDLYQRFLSRAWKDGRVQSEERETLTWAGQCLELRDPTIRALNLDAARPRFSESLAKAMDDGVITSEEAATLEEITKAAGMSLREFVTEFFGSESEAFLRGIFSAIVADNHLPDDAFERMITSAARLGLTRDEVLAAIKTQAERCIEHVLADAKEDGILSIQEEQALISLLKKVVISSDMRAYVAAEIKDLRCLTDIRNGKLPSLPHPPGVSLRAGELVHFHGSAIWESLKLLKSGPSRSSHHGILLIADSRFIFGSQTRSESFHYSSVVNYSAVNSTIEVQVKNKPVQRFLCKEGGRIAPTIFGSALAMANQVLRNQYDEQESRHIPRDVRQRTWQRYGGQCAECRSTSYLEFDHVVPFSKGGSNSDANVQLLCRNCNLKKSDRI